MHATEPPVPEPPTRDLLADMITKVAADERALRERMWNSRERAFRLKQDLNAAEAEAEAVEAERRMGEVQTFLRELWDHFREVTGERPPA